MADGWYFSRYEKNHLSAARYATDKTPDGSLLQILVEFELTALRMAIKSIAKSQTTQPTADLRQTNTRRRKKRPLDSVSNASLEYCSRRLKFTNWNGVSNNSATCRHRKETRWRGRWNLVHNRYNIFYRSGDVMWNYLLTFVCNECLFSSSWPVCTVAQFKGITGEVNRIFFHT